MASLKRVLRDETNVPAKDDRHCPGLDDWTPTLRRHWPVYGTDPCRIRMRRMTQDDYGEGASSCAARDRDPRRLGPSPKVLPLDLRRDVNATRTVFDAVAESVLLAVLQPESTP